MYHLILDTDERDYIAQLVVDCDPPPPPPPPPPPAEVPELTNPVVFLLQNYED